MTLADTSAWIEYLRATGSEAHHAARALVRDGEAATTDVVVMEVLAGARDDDERVRLRRLLARGAFVPVHRLGDHEDAADSIAGAAAKARRSGRSLTA